MRAIARARSLSTVVIASVTVAAALSAVALVDARDRDLRGGAGTACSFDPATGVLAIGFSSATGTADFPDILQPRIARRGEEITVRGGLGPPLACAGGFPTVRNTDRIELTESGEVVVLLDLELDKGPLAPGATPEVGGSSEIEIESFLTDAEFLITPSEKPEHYSFGSGPQGLGANLNAAERNDDVDLLFNQLEDPRSSFAVEVATFSGRRGSNRGNDRYSAAGGAGTGEAFPYSVLFVGGKGEDRLTGSRDRDTIYGGEQRDRIDAGAGNDRVNSLGAQRDRVDCGPGRDLAEASRNDRLQSCERVSRDGPVLRSFARE